MTDIPEGALQAAVEALSAHPWNSYPHAAHRDHTFDSACMVCQADLEPIARVILEAAAPILAAQVRRQVAEEIAALADVKHPDYTPAKFDAFLEQYGLTYPHLRPALKAIADYIGRADRG